MAKQNDEDRFYTELIDFAFNRNADISSWAWDVELREPEADPETIVGAIRRLCINCKEDLIHFNNLQVAGGLEYVFNNAFSNYSFSLLDDEVSEEMRRSAFRSLHLLFANCFEQRCDQFQSHGLSKARDNPLNGVCYMFWDTSPLSAGGLDALRVMENSLYLGNVACIESGLHGLGHAYYKNQDYVTAAVDKFLASSSKFDEQLVAYAKSARTGYIQ